MTLQKDINNWNKSFDRFIELIIKFLRIDKIVTWLSKRL